MKYLKICVRSQLIIISVVPYGNKEPKPCFALPNKIEMCIVIFSYLNYVKID